MQEPPKGKQWSRKIVVASAFGAGIIGADDVRRYHVVPKQLCGIPPANYQPPQPRPAVAPIVAVSSLGQLLTLPAADLPATAPTATTPSRTSTIVTTPGGPSQTITTTPIATTPAAISTTITNATALPIARSTVKPLARLKYFQFAPTTLAIDHCSISRIAFTIQEDGRWRLTLQADQNPVVETATALTTVLPSSNSSQLLPTTSKPSLPIAPIRALPAGTAKDTAFLKRNLFVVRVRGLGAFGEEIAIPAQPSILGKPVLFRTPPIEFWVQNGVPYSVVCESHSSDAKTFFDVVDRVEIEFEYR
jgi:hypothetical protein